MNSGAPAPPTPATCTLHQHPWDRILLPLSQDIKNQQHARNLHESKAAHLSSSPNPNSANSHTLPTADESAIAGTDANRILLLDGPPIQTNQFIPSGDVSHKSFAKVLKENPTAPNHTQDDVSLR